MALTFAATGATSYQYRPASPQENTPRVVLEIAIEGIVAEAIVDTGGVYLLCHPRLARQLDMDASQAVSSVIELLFRGVFLQGRLHRLSLTLLAEAGENLGFEATALGVALKLTPPRFVRRPSSLGSVPEGDRACGPR